MVLSVRMAVGQALAQFVRGYLASEQARVQCSAVVEFTEPQQGLYVSSVSDSSTQPTALPRHLQATPAASPTECQERCCLLSSFIPGEGGECMGWRFDARASRESFGICSLFTEDVDVSHNLAPTRGPSATQLWGGVRLTGEDTAIEAHLPHLYRPCNSQPHTQISADGSLVALDAWYNAEGKAQGPEVGLRAPLNGDLSNLFCVLLPSEPL